MELMQASRQWASRPNDQRFTSLDALIGHTRDLRDRSATGVISSRKIECAPVEGDPTHRQLVVQGPDGAVAAPTHWAFGQLAARAGAPAGYLRSLPADITADAINFSLHKQRADDVGFLIRTNPGDVAELAAATGPAYGRIWNADIALSLRDRFGDGVTGDFRVPGEFGVGLERVTKENTTIFASDRDMFVFLADENNRIEIPNRRDGRSGSLARGFFVQNSEVGSATLRIATFLFDYVCCNRIVWGAEGFSEIAIRHTASAPDRWLEEVVPAIEAYSHGSSHYITDAISAAQLKKLETERVEEFLVGRRFTRNQAKAINLAHIAEEGRPIESLWDATVGATAYAKGIKYQDERVDIERKAGKIMSLAS